MTYYCYPGVIDSKYIPAQMTAEIRLQYAKQIIETVCNFYGVKKEDVFSKSRKTDLIRAAQVSTYFIKDRMPTLDLITIAGMFGNRYVIKSGYGYDHAAVIYNISKVKGFIKVNDPLKEDIEILKNTL
jgi:chromosomal replication initiator protein